MKKPFFKIATAVLLGLFTFAVMCCCLPMVLSAKAAMAKAEHQSCHQTADASSSSQPIGCECEEMITVAVEKTNLGTPAYGYFKWVFEKPHRSITLYSFPTNEPATGGPPTRYASALPLYLTNSILRI